MIDAEDLMAQFDELGAMIPVGFESCIVGVVERFGMEPVALLDRDRCIAVLMGEEHGSPSEDEAAEFFDFNIGQAWHGDQTPAFCRLLSTAQTP
tara:strand:+ start:216 stop:497 length:282 start_codon:yes stop_codon:yes gene_type:complete